MSGRSLKILVANHRWWFPTSVSGADIANHEFAREMVQQGATVRVHGIVAPRTDERTRQRSYMAEGVRVGLVQSDYLKEFTRVIQSYKPDIVLTSSAEPQCGEGDIARMMDLLHHHGIPVAIYVHDPGKGMQLFRDVRHQLAAVITNSHFMAGRIRQEWEMRPHVVYPVPDRRSFRPPQYPGSFITFFNPLPHKGLHIAHELVKTHFPDRSFLFVEGFIDPESHGISLTRSGNLIHARRSPDVATIYLMTRTIIIPSQWEEPFGRVAVEAMYHRIPVVASHTGGLIESVGDGGLLLSRFSEVEAWVDAIEKLDERPYRDDVVAAGEQYVKKFSLPEQVGHFLDILRRIVR
ncbi:MAG: glycosyltransferase family 4 protein [Proteobacteria bacterium]|nr:glycosyltransferase family 4 protein [Pseudomonadota bacterium]